MRRILIASPYFFLAASVFGAFTPYYTDPLTSINTTNWGQNGTLTASSSGLTSSNANGGSLISKIAPPVSPYEYEADITLALTVSGGTFDVYLDASTDALSGPTPSGTYYAFELTPTFSGSTCTAGLNVYKRVSSTITLLGTTTVPCHNGTVLRAVRTSHLQICAFIDNIAYAIIAENSLTSGMPGVGVRNAPAANSITQASLYPIYTTPPSPVNPQTLGTSEFPTRVDLQWQPPSDGANGPGVNFYYIYRNSTSLAQSTEPEFSDETVVAGTAYTYWIIATDYHQNQSTTTINITTPPANAIDPRRVGVRPTGSYWGAAGEQIDALSGNLNYSTQLFKAMGRGGSGVGVNLSYNSQLWRQDPGGTWKLDYDVGYGLGWRLQAGSLTPFYSAYLTIDHYTFVDPTGAEYRLDQNNSGIWGSTQGIYVWYDSRVTPGVLHFPDGSFWVMGTISAGTEQDAGTEYPTVMEDSNGNQIFLRYNDGLGVNWPNSSARFTEIEDVRAIYNPSTRTNQSYTFTYNTDPIPHLTQIANVVGKASESYTLSYLENQTLKSPFTPFTSYGTTTFLQSVAITTLGYTTSFTYDSVTNSGELTSATNMFGGKIRWAYGPFTFNGSRTLREVQNRYLTMTSGGAESAAYTLTRSAGDSNLTVHSGLTLDDPSGIGEKAWTFSTSGSAWQLGLTTRYEDRPSVSQASSPLQRKDFTWVQDSVGNPYIGTVLTSLDPTGPNVQTQTTQTLDTYGNVLTSKIYDYGNLTTPARTYTNTYITGTNHTSRYIYNRLLTSVLSNATQNVTLVTNTYDSTSITDLPGVREHDSAYTTGMIYRGNVTVTTPAGGATVTINRDIGGNVVTATDPVTATSISTTSTTNYAAPSMITPNSNTNLQTSVQYTPWLGMASVTAPNSSTASTVYDSYGLPYTSTSVYGAQTSYSYAMTSYGYFIQSMTNGHWEQHYLDGFGRTTTLNRGYGTTFVSTVNTVYGPCACSPLGKVVQVSQPYAPGDPVYWTTYTYDGLGRTYSVVLPDNVSTTTYGYWGNLTTITDPVGNWKVQAMDAMGNLTSMTEPNPAGGGGAYYVTSYTYDVMNHLTGVSMPRPTGTQTRSFVYDSNQHLSSVTNPESGATTYTYNADATLATKTDAKGQVAKYTYDSYKRVTTIKRYPNPGQPTTEDTCQRTTITYDTGTNGWGRVATAQWGISPCTAIWGQSYGYTQAGLVTSNGSGASATYNSEGRVVTVTHPAGSDAGRTYTYSFDAMGRPVSMVDNQSPPVTWVQNVTYNAADLILQLPGLLPETRQYNSLLQLTALTHNGVLDLYYTYPTQNNGRIQSSMEYTTGQPERSTNYFYDSLNRLQWVNADVGWGLGFTYDGFGNLTDKTATSGSPPSLHVTVNAATNQIYGYSYDANGNLTSIPGQMAVTYDAENRVATLLPHSGGTETYGYTPDNKRVYRKEPNGTQVTYAYGVSGELLTAFNTVTGQTLWRNVYFGSTLIATQNYFNGVYMGVGPVARDRVGSVRVGPGGSSYYPYGEEYPVNGGDTEEFATYFRDGTSGLDYAQNRYYNSILGRFMTADPSRSNALTDPGQWNKYAYVGNDPVNWYDPSGLGQEPASGGFSMTYTPGTVSTSPTANDPDFDSVSNGYLYPIHHKSGSGAPWPGPCPQAPWHPALGPNNAQANRNVEDAVAFNNELDSLVSLGTMNSATAALARLDYMWEEFQTKGPQDYKSNPALTPGSAAYKQMDAFGNYNFGAVGQALGFSTGFLQFSAGLASFGGLVKASLSEIDSYGALATYLPPDWGTPLTGPSWGDNPADQALIAQGASWGMGFLRGKCK